MRNSVNSAIVLGIFGAIILVFQMYANVEIIQPENPNNILFFEFGITVFASHLVVYGNNLQVRFLELFFTGYLCMLTLLAIAASIIWVTGLSIFPFTYDDIPFALTIASIANILSAFLISNLKLKRRVETNPDILDDFDF